MALNETQRSDLRERLQRVKHRMALACEGCGRAVNDVRLVAVSKFHPADAVRAAYELGQCEFGENYVQEMVKKLADLSDLPDLHMRFIGHLQRNKARDIVNARCAVDTVDSLAMAQELSKRAERAGHVVEVLVQVNVGREPQKAGVLPEQLPALLSETAGLRGVRVAGLMAIPPARDSAEESRQDFRLLASLAAQHGLAELSMGMSDDLEVAIEEGATMVRVGTAIFGPRPAK